MGVAVRNIAGKQSAARWLRAGFRCLTGGLLLCAVLSAQGQTGWKLAWSDEFNGAPASAPDAGNWVFQSGPGAAVGGNNEAEYYCAYGMGRAPCVASQPNAYLDGRGHLVVVAVRTGESLTLPGKKERVPVYSSARLNSLKSFQYGRIEASIRVPTGQGVWPAFWAMGHEQGGLHWPATGEVDIMESWNPQPETGKVDPYINHGSVHGPVAPGSGTGYVEVTGSYSPAYPMAQGFHQFAIEWQPGEVDFYCDGHLYSRQSVASLREREVWEMDNAPFYLLLNLAMGGGFFGYPDATTPATPTMVVDYVRVYEREQKLLPEGWGNADIGGPAEAGSSSELDGLWQVAGSGAGIAGRVDQFQYAYHALSGDGEVSAHLIDQSSKVAQAKAGIMMRDGRGSGARYVLLFLSPDGSLHFRSRGNDNDVPGEALLKGAAQWFKLVRQGDVFYAQTSVDGKQWQTVGQARVVMHKDVLAGLAVTVRDNGQPNTVHFDSVAVSRSDAAWDGAAAVLPGVVQAELFNVGGEGYSYAAAIHHKGDVAMRAGEGPAVRQIAAQGEPQVHPGGYYLADLPRDSYLNYAVEVEREGTYLLRMSVSSAGAGGALHLNLDQKPVTGSLAIPDTGGVEKWAEVKAEGIHLAAGHHTLALVVDAVGAHNVAGNVDYLSLQLQ